MNNDRIVSGDDVIARTTIDHIIAASVQVIRPTRHIVAADEIIIAGVAIQLIVALLASDEVVAVVTVDDVISASISNSGEHRCHTSVNGPRIIDLGMIAKDDVIAGAAGNDISGSAANNNVIAHATEDRVNSTECWLGTLDQRYGTAAKQRNAQADWRRGDAHLPRGSGDRAEGRG